VQEAGGCEQRNTDEELRHLHHAEAGRQVQPEDLRGERDDGQDITNEE
jgi:hypothetical protein